MSATSTTDERTIRESHLLLVMSFALFGMAVRPATVVNTIYVVLGLGILTLAARRQLRPEIDPPAQAIRLARITWLFAVVLVLSALADVRLPPLDDGRLAVWYGLAGAWIVAMATVHVLGRHNRTSTLLIAVLVSVISVLGLFLVTAVDPTPAIDVWDLHRVAADRLADGENPYRDLGVPSTSPNDAPGTTIDGYPYPPVTLLWFSLGSWAGDPRIAGLLAWLATNLMLAWFLGNRCPDQRTLTTGILLLLAAQPGWLFVLDQAWTEPLTLMLVSASVLAWMRFPLASGIALGLALASKQYMLVLAPAILLLPDPHRTRRLLGIIGAAVGSIAPFIVVDPRAFWDATVAFHLNTTPRADASNLAGLSRALGDGVTPPTWLALAGPATLVGWMVRRARNRGQITLAMALGLTVFFLLASQAFANYWFLVAGLIILSLVVSVADSLGTNPDGAR